MNRLDVDLLLTEGMEDRKARLTEVFGADTLESEAKGVATSGRGKTAYQTRGDFMTWCRKEVFGDRRYDGIVAEFGTYPVFPVLSALRAENQASHWGVPDSPSTLRAKSRLKEVFVPEDPAWRSSTAVKGVEIVERAIAFAAKP